MPSPKLSAAHVPIPNNPPMSRTFDYFKYALCHVPCEDLNTEYYCIVRFAYLQNYHYIKYIYLKIESNMEWNLQSVKPHSA